MTVAEAKKREIRPLTGIRGFAASLVLVTHLFPFWIVLLPSLSWLRRLSARGATGVDLFFILSGFILSYVYFDPVKSRLGWREYGSFIGHRFVRIWPVHFATIALLVSMVLGARIFSLTLTGSYPVSALPFQLTMTHAWPCPPGSQHPDPLGEWTWNYPSWSISAEWFAYLLVFPAMWPVLKWLKDRGKFSFLLCLASVAIWSVFIMPAQLAWGSATCAVILEFAAGALLYNVFCSTAIITGICQRLATLTFVIVVSALLVCPLESPLFSSFIILLFPVLLLGLTAETALISKVFATPPALWLGRVSFSLYMTQAIVQKILKVILVPDHYRQSPLALRLALLLGTLAMFFLLATVFYYLIENPSRYYLRKLADRWTGGSKSRRLPQTK